MRWCMVGLSFRLMPDNLTKVGWANPKVLFMYTPLSAKHIAVHILLGIGTPDKPCTTGTISVVNCIRNAP